MISYNDFFDQIKEGLIYTHNILKYENNLKIQLDAIGVEYDLNILNKLTFTITIKNICYFEKYDLYNSFFDLIVNLYGYFPTYFIVKRKNGMENRFVFDEEIFKKNLINITDFIIIRFEAKYSDGERKNDIIVPDKLYHISPSIYHRKIMNDGLEPKSKNRITKHNPRIYLFFFLEDKDLLLKRLKNNDILKNGVEREYNTYEIVTTNNMIIHSDPNFERGCYTYDNIHPKNIKLLQ